METDRIAYTLIGIATCADHQPGRVQQLDGGSHVGNIKFTPALVEEHPCNHRWMVVQLRQHAPQFIAIMRATPLGPIIAHGHILPDQHPQPVRPVVPARRLDFHVFADKVEAERTRCFNVVAEGLIGGRSVQAIRPITLVEHAHLKERLPVEMHARHASNRSG